MLRALLCEMKIPAIAIGSLWAVHSVARLGGDITLPADPMAQHSGVMEETEQEGNLGLVSLEPQE